MTNESHVGARLKEERKRLGITQADAALLAAVTREQWSRYEHGAMPGADTLLRLNGHGFDVNYVLGGGRTVSDATMTEPEQQLLTHYRATDDEGREAIDRAARLEVLRRQGKPAAR